MEITERQGTKADEKWLWEIYESLMKEPISKQWGWDLSYQKQNFKTKLAAVRFKIVSIEAIDVAAYLVDEEPNHYYLRMLLVTKKYQNKGIGRKLVEQIKSIACREGKSVILSVIKANPVLAFYTNLGFAVVGEKDGNIILAFDSSGTAGESVTV